ncbi:putative lipid II flippase FtsW [Candidatus Acetothermia bacterium]|nr:putative lipid II flippase FtsW [Candidatus Acetothermia bacterium]
MQERLFRYANNSWGGEKKSAHSDRLLLLTTIILFCCGLVMVYSTTYPVMVVRQRNSFQALITQLVAGSIGLGLLVFFARFDYRRFVRYDDLLLISMFMLTFLTILPLGAFVDRRWIRLGFFNLQPTELLNFALVIYLAAATLRKEDQLASFRQGITPFCILLLIISAVVLQQPDFSMVFRFWILTGFMLFLAGAKITHLIGIGTITISLALLMVKLAPYRMARLIAFIDPFSYQMTAGFQTIQSLTAIGAGGLFGRGIGNSQAKLLHLPAAHNDFIFSITAEEIGFIGALLLLSLFLIFGWRALKIAQRAPDRFGYMLAMGLGFTICVQALLNISIAVGLFPVTGLTLPFISHGGSSLVVSLAMVGILLNISKQGAKTCA